ncbi:hypothetical protein FOL47_005810 [Perkinsus chesapeaki]|uniref:Uncharacterized protein n=1 Tax=Perkinsus chesapeaki TaxID=330153 RepID=A0A7J6LVZ7_PERCH|nr:hypothetical protein FOL47_005810 [Perkinsus chesapeaki]
MYSDVVDSPPPDTATDRSSVGNRNRRWEPEEGSVIIPDKIHVFGVTKMNTPEISLYFSDLCRIDENEGEDSEMAVDSQSVGIEWLDDHSCNIRCGSDEAAKRALEHPTATKIDGPWTLSELIELPGKKQFQLCFRYATDKDVKKAGRTWRDSQFYRQSLNRKGYDRNGDRLEPRGIHLKPRRGRNRRQRSRSRSPVGGRVEVDDEERARRAKRQERFGVVEKPSRNQPRRYHDGEGSSSEDDWSKKGGCTMGILRDDDIDEESV